MKTSIITIILLSLSLSLFSQGDTCGDAMEITINNTYASDGPSTGGGCHTCPGTTVNSDWFTFTPAENTTISLSSCIDGLDTHFYVYEGSCDNLTEVAANDDAGCGVGTNFASYAEFSVVAGTQYFIEWVDQWSLSPFNFVIEEIICPAPINLGFNTLTDQSVTIDWESANTGVGYILEYGEFGFTFGQGTQVSGIIGTDGPSVTIDGLTPSTSYELYLIENCDGGDIVTDPINFITNDFLAANDICSNSIEISCGDNLDGSTANATIDTNASDCGPVTVDANGVWYHFTGLDGWITVSTCGSFEFDSRISVYSGSCDNLSCVSANDDDIACVNFASTTHFPASVGVDYYILVHGFEGASGDFTLSLTCEDICNPVPDNGSCATATSVAPTEGCQMVAANNQCASINLFNPPCSPFEETQDIWYTFNSGAFTTLGIDINLLDAEDMGFSIYANCGAESQVCFDSVNDDLQVFSVTANTDYIIQFWSEHDKAGAFEFCLRSDVCSGSTNITVDPISDSSVIISWNSANEGNGYDLEYGPVGFTLGGGTSTTGTLINGNQSVTLTGLEPSNVYSFYLTENCAFGEVVSGPFNFTTTGSAPTNDNCTNAITIDGIGCGTSVDGTTVNATVADVVECEGVASTSPGVWYQINTTDGLVTYESNTCGNADFDTKLTVFSGTCDNLECVTANDDYVGCSGGTSRVIYNGTNGPLYILVHGFGSTEGDFTLSTSCSSGIAEVNKDASFDVYPNPSDGIISIDVSGLTLDNAINLTIYNVQGQLVFQKNQVQTINGMIQNIVLDQVSEGLYNVVIGDGSHQYNSRLIIE